LWKEGKKFRQGAINEGLGIKIACAAGCKETRMKMERLRSFGC
jgi:hypothetical protein